MTEAPQREPGWYWVKFGIWLIMEWKDGWFWGIGEVGSYADNEVDEIGPRILPPGEPDEAAERDQPSRYSYGQSVMKPPFWIVKDGERHLAEVWKEDDAKRLVVALAAAPDRDAVIERLTGELADERMEHSLLKELLSRPEIDDFWEGIVTEAAHQRQRWGDAHDRDKSAENWFWLVGYLSGKALRASIEGDKAKAKHHTISTAAALFQWHQAIRADETGRGIGADADISPEDGRLGDESFDAQAAPKMEK
jgi:hypothetical protein